MKTKLWAILLGSIIGGIADEEVSTPPASDETAESVADQPSPQSADQPKSVLIKSKPAFLLSADSLKPSDTDSEVELQLLTRKRAEFHGLLGDAIKTGQSQETFIKKYSLFQPLTSAETNSTAWLPRTWRDPIHDDMQGWVLFGIRK